MTTKHITIEPGDELIVITSGKDLLKAFIDWGMTYYKAEGDDYGLWCTLAYLPVHPTKDALRLAREKSGQSVTLEQFRVWLPETMRQFFNDMGVK